MATGGHLGRNFPQARELQAEKSNPLSYHASECVSPRLPSENSCVWHILTFYEIILLVHKSVENGNVVDL